MKNDIVFQNKNKVKEKKIILSGENKVKTISCISCIPKTWRTRAHAQGSHVAPPYSKIQEVKQNIPGVLARSFELD